MVNKRLLFDCDGRQQIPGVNIAGGMEIIPSGKAFNYISEYEENQAIFRQIKENCDICFLTEQKVRGFNIYPIPIIWFFAYDSRGNYFGTLNGLGDIEDKVFPVVFINSIKGTHGRITENMKEFFSLVNYYPYWRRVIECEQQGMPYDLNDMEEQIGEDGQYFERQKEIGETLSLSKDPDAIKLLIDRIHSEPGFVIYESKQEAEKENEFITMEFIIEAAEQYLDDLAMMALDLWPDNEYEVLKDDFLNIFKSDKDKVLLFCRDNEPISFIHLSIRSDYVEGAESSPTGYIEGIYVKPNYRRMGISRKLLNSGEQWLKDKGCRQIGSDTGLDNKVSYDFHTSNGFKEAGRIIAFIKNLD